VQKSEFDDAFQRYVAGPLGSLGFAASGKTIALHEPPTTIALIRLGGKMAAPGGISHTLCFRHSFLRDLAEQPAIPTAPPRSVFAYPVKLLPSEWQERGMKSWTYKPQNLNFGLDRIEWDNRPAHQVEAQLKSLADFLAKDFLPWARALDPARAASEIRRRGENAWCERLWLEDYDAFSAVIGTEAE